MPDDGLTVELVIVGRGAGDMGWKISMLGRRVMSVACISLAILGVIGLGQNLLASWKRQAITSHSR